MSRASLTTRTSCGVTLLSDERRPGGVTFAFTQRTGGVSEGVFASLNLGDACGDEPARVAENRRRALDAVGATELFPRLVNPRQVHGTRVVTVVDGSPVGVAAAQAQAREGADAVVCVASDVPVLLCYADCVPVVLAAPGGFAVVHSGWRGTIARICEVALAELCRAAGCGPKDVWAYVGPHVGGTDYQVSGELIARFGAEFGPGVCLPGDRLDLGVAVVATLLASGVGEGRLSCCDDSTATHTDQYFSYRASGGACGRHGALAWLPNPDAGRG